MRKGTEPEDDDRSYEWRVQWWRGQLKLISIFQKNSQSISGSGSSDERTYGIRVTNCHELDHGHWEVKTKSGSNAADASEPASESDGSFNVTIVKPPANILLEPENINVNFLSFHLDYCVSVCSPLRRSLLRMRMDPSHRSRSPALQSSVALSHDLSGK